MTTSTITDERGVTYRSTTVHGPDCGTCRAAEQAALGLLRSTGSVSAGYGDTGNCHAKVERTPKRVVAHGRAEHETCEAGTPGCCIDHLRDASGSCDTW